MCTKRIKCSKKIWKGMLPGLWIQVECLEVGIELNGNLLNWTRESTAHHGQTPQQWMWD